MSAPAHLFAFLQGRLIAEGDPLTVARALLAQASVAPESAHGPMPIVLASDGRPVDLDLSGGLPRIDARYGQAAAQRSEAARPARGRPKLGVTAREVTLLPRHWEWLNTQPGGASAALRRLVDAARRSHADADTCRTAQEAAYRAMSALAGDAPGFEAASRALFSGDRVALDRALDAWPEDVCRFIRGRLDVLSEDSPD